MIGISQPLYLDLMVQALRRLGKRYALVYSSKDKLDEFSPVEATEYRLLKRGRIYQGVLKVPREIQIASLDNLRVNLDTSKSTNISILKGEHLEGANMLSLNVAAACYLWDLSLEEGFTEFQEYVNKKSIEIKKNILSGFVWDSLKAKNLVS